MKQQEKKKPGCLVRLLLVFLTLVVVISATLVLVGIMESEPGNNSGEQSSEQQSSGILRTQIVNNDSFSAYYIGAQDQSSLGVFYVYLKIENNLQTNVMVNLEDASVDGETVPLITTGVPLVIAPGNSGQTGFIFSMVNLSISSMDEADQATFRIVLRDSKSLDKLTESDPITIDLH